jgi:hypothetical protein
MPSWDDLEEKFKKRTPTLFYIIAICILFMVFVYLASRCFKLDKDTYGRWIGICVFAPALWYMADTGDTRLLKPFAVGLVVWEMLWVTCILRH